MGDWAVAQCVPSGEECITSVSLLAIDTPAGVLRRETTANNALEIEILDLLVIFEKFLIAFQEVGFVWIACLHTLRGYATAPTVAGIQLPLHRLISSRNTLLTHLLYFAQLRIV